MNLWVQLAIYVVSAVVAYARRVKPQAPQAATLSDFDFPQATEGTVQVEVFGTDWVDDWCVVGVGNFRTSAIRK